MKKSASALVSAGAVAGALAAGRRYGPQHASTALWYGSLEKPSYTPPGPAIGAAWTILGGLLAYSGYRLISAPPSRGRASALSLWWANIIGIAAYPWVFFGRKKLGASSVLVGGMLASAAASVATTSRVDRPAAIATAPLVAWVAFAGLLSEELWRRNVR